MKRFVILCVVLLCASLASADPNDYIGYMRNIRAYGAIENDVTGDANAIQAAIDDAEYGGIVYIPTGIYLIEKALEPKPYVIFQGEGLGSVFKCTSGNTDKAIFSTSGIGMGFCVFRDLALRSDCADANGFDIDKGSYTYAINGCEFHNVDIYAEMHTGIRGYLSNCKLEHVRIGYLGTHGSYFRAIHNESSGGNRAGVNNSYRNCIFNKAIGGSGCIETVYAINEVYDNCIFEDCNVPPVYATGVNGLRFNSCSFERNQPGGTGNALVTLEYDDRGPTWAHFDMCRFTNSGSTPFTAVAYAKGSNCWAGFTKCTGGLTSGYWVKDYFGDYDAACTHTRGLMYARMNVVTGYSGTVGNQNLPDYEYNPTYWINGADPTVVLVPRASGSTAFWIGIKDDALDFGTGTTKGSNIKMTLSSAGVLAVSDHTATLAYAVSHSYSGGTTTWTLSTAETAGSEFTVTNAGGAVTMTFPAVQAGKPPFAVINTSGYTLTVKVSGQTGITTANGKTSLCRFGSSDVVEIYEQP